MNSDNNGEGTQVLPLIAEHIVASSDICGGRPRIAGHRITVQNVVIWTERGGLSPDQIASRWKLTLSEVFSALAYYHDHRDEIRSRIEEDERFANEMKEKSSSLLHSKLPQPHGQDDPMSPG